MTEVAPVAIALYNEGEDNAGFDWINGGFEALPLLAHNVSRYLDEELPEKIHSVRMFVLDDAPIFENDDCSDLLIDWIDERVLGHSEGDPR